MLKYVHKLTNVNLTDLKIAVYGQKGVFKHRKPCTRYKALNSPKLCAHFRQRIESAARTKNTTLKRIGSSYILLLFIQLNFCQ